MAARSLLLVLALGGLQRPGAAHAAAERPTAQPQCLGASCQAGVSDEGDTFAAMQVRRGLKDCRTLELYLVGETSVDVGVGPSNNTTLAGTTNMYSGGLYDSANGTQRIGKYRGVCILLLDGGEEWQCHEDWSFDIGGGLVTFGPWNPNADTIVTITGGSGKYFGAGGEAVQSNLANVTASYKYVAKWCM